MLMEHFSSLSSSFRKTLPTPDNSHDSFFRTCTDFPGGRRVKSCAHRTSLLTMAATPLGRELLLQRLPDGHRRHPAQAQGRRRLAGAGLNPERHPSKGPFEPEGFFLREREGLITRAQVLRRSQMRNQQKEVKLKEAY